MLNVALHPTTVASSVVDDITGHFFIAAFEIGKQEYVPTSTTQHCRFHKVVTQDVAAKGRFAWECWQSAMIDKGFHANNRVVAPIVGGTGLPKGNAGCQHRAIKHSRELYKTTKERCLAHWNWNSLDQARTRIRLHGANHTQQAFAAHNAVGIQNNHVLVAFAPTL